MIIANVKKLFCASIVVATVFLGIFTGCQDVTLDKPSVSGKEVQKQVIQATSTKVSRLWVTATHGKKQNIHLQWSKIDEAFKYRILRSVTPFNENKQYLFKFAQQVYASVYEQDETTGNTIRKDITTCDMTVIKGATVYYKIEAYDKNDKLIETSNIAEGTALAEPVFSITSTETTANLFWYMDNCTSGTYRDSAEIIVECFEDEAGTVLFAQKKVALKDSTDDKVVFTGLEVGKRYYYKTTTYLKETPEITETYGPIDEITAHNLIPQPPKDLKATRGTRISGIEVSWTAPDLSYIKEQGKDIPLPLYFTIERKSNKGSIYVSLASYIGVNPKQAGAGIYKFDGSKTPSGIDIPDQKTAKNVDCWTSAKELSMHFDTVPDDDHFKMELKQYVAGARFTFVDTTAKRDEIYTYRIKSYKDNVETVMSCPEDPECEGFLMSMASLQCTPDNAEVSGDTKVNKVEVSMDLHGFDPRGVEYRYFVASSQRKYIPKAGSTDITDEDLEKTPGAWQYVDEMTRLSDFIVNYDVANESITNADTKLGVYNYKVIVVSKDVGASDVGSILQENDPEAATKALGGDKKVYDIFKSTTESLVMNDTKFSPKIRLFEVVPGYTDQFFVRFEYDPNYNYILCKDGSPVADINGKVGTALPNSGTVKDETITDKDNNSVDIKVYQYPYKFSAVNSNRTPEVKFTLKAKTVLTVEKVSTPSAVQSLGVPSPKMDDTFASLSYRRIKFTWQPVDGASRYEISAKYKEWTGEPDKYKVELVPEADRIISITDEDKDKEKEYILKDPLGYNDASIAGRDIEFTVTAVSDKYDVDSYNSNAVHAANTSTSGKATGYLIGPALLGLKIGTPTYNSVKLEWTAVKGARGYEIYRYPYADVEGTRFEAEGSTRKWDALFFIPGQAVTSYEDVWNSVGNGNITVEKQSDHDGDMIRGYPYEYVVVPVLKGGDLQNSLGEDRADKTDAKIDFVALGRIDDKGNLLDENGVKYDGEDNIKALHVTSATLGCGLDVRASKLYREGYVKGSNNGIDKIIVDWKQPYWLSAKGKQQAETCGLSMDLRPTVYRVSANSEDAGATHYATKGDGETTYTDTLSEGTGAGTSLSEQDKRDVLKSTSHYYYVAYGNDKAKFGKDASEYKTYMEEMKGVPERRYLDLYKTLYGTVVNSNNKESYAVKMGDTNEYVQTESQNKGYMLYLTQGMLRASCCGGDTSEKADKYYSEKLHFDSWDTANRRLCPTKYEFQLKNLNIDAKWHTVAVLDYYGGKYTLEGQYKYDGKKDDGSVGNNTSSNFDVYVDYNEGKEGEGGSYSTDLYLTPGMIRKANKGCKTTNGYGKTSNVGLLKVLRDYKHYYQMIASCDLTTSTEEGATSETMEHVVDKQWNEKSDIYIYRNITDEELAKCTMLILGDATKGISGSHGTGTGTLGTEGFISTGNPKSGSFTWDHESSSTFYWKINQYVHGWTNIPAGGELTAFISLTDSPNDKTERGYKKNSTWYHISGKGHNYGVDNLIPLKVELAPDAKKDLEKLPCYTGTVGLASNGQNDECLSVHIKVAHGSDSLSTAGIFEVRNAGTSVVKEGKVTSKKKNYDCWGEWSGICNTWEYSFHWGTTHSCWRCNFSNDNNIMMQQFTYWNPMKLGDRGWCGEGTVGQTVNDNWWAITSDWWPDASKIPSDK